MKPLKACDSVDCRYGEELIKAFGGDMEVLWEACERDYQGYAAIVGWSEEHHIFVVYSYSYGSCSGCDGWEACGADEGSIAREMYYTAGKLSTVNHLWRYLKAIKAIKDVRAESREHDWYSPTCKSCGRSMDDRDISDSIEVIMDAVMEAGKVDKKWMVTEP